VATALLGRLGFASTSSYSSIVQRHQVAHSINAHATWWPCCSTDHVWGSHGGQKKTKHYL